MVHLVREPLRLTGTLIQVLKNDWKTAQIPQKHIYLTFQ